AARVFAGRRAGLGEGDVGGDRQEAQDGEVALPGVQLERAGDVTGGAVHVDTDGADDRNGSVGVLDLADAVELEVVVQVRDRLDHTGTDRPGRRCRVDGRVVHRLGDHVALGQHGAAGRAGLDAVRGERS